MTVRVRAPPRAAAPRPILGPGRRVWEGFGGFGRAGLEGTATIGADVQARRTAETPTRGPMVATEPSLTAAGGWRPCDPSVSTQFRGVGARDVVWRVDGGHHGRGDVPRLRGTHDDARALGPPSGRAAWCRREKRTKLKLFMGGRNGFFFFFGLVQAGALLYT